MSTIPYVPTYLRAAPPTIWPATSPLDFGAIGNGSADDYPAITAALDALAAKGGGTLVFPNDRDFRIATPGVHGIHLRQQSNITILMGERSRLIMDNMVDGLAVSHGIFVEGPCENIALIGVHATYATRPAYRQGWASIYFLGANVGNGDRGAGIGWYRGNPDRSEDWQGIEAGAVRNIHLENVTSEYSPSVGIGIVGVDGLRGYNITVKDSYADGLYHVYFRNSRIDGYHGINVGDDGLSMASYESDLEAADIELPFHGEGSTFSNIVLEGRDPNTPAGSIVPLGVRDVAITDVVVIDRFRGIKLEPGLHLTFDPPDFTLLSINFLANRRVTISNVTLNGCVQDISFFVKECNASTDRKWWYHEMLISNVIGSNGSSPFDFYGYGIPESGGPPLPIFGGITFQNLKFSNYASPYTTLAGMIDCTFDGLEMDSFLSVQGFVPYGSDPDLLDGDGNPVWLDNASTFRNIRCNTIVFQGLKKSLIDNVHSHNAPRRAISLSTCADVTLKQVRAIMPNRVDDPLDNGGIAVDEFCKRITIDGWEVQQDGHSLTSLGLLNAEDHWADNGRVITTQDVDGPLVAMVSDQRWIDERVSQIGRVEYFHRGNGVGRGVRRFPEPLLPERRGDSDANLFVGIQGARQYLVHPLSADRTWTLHEGGAAIGDRLEIVRAPGAGGNYSLILQGQEADINAFPTSDAKTTVKVAGSDGGQLTSLLVNETIELLGAPVAWVTSDVAAAAALAGAINAHTSGFTAAAFENQVTIGAPAGSYETYNNAKVGQTAAGDFVLSVGFISRMTGGAGPDSAGERPASTSFLLVGDFFPDFSGTIASITVNGTELLSEPVAWEQNSNIFASLVAENIMDGFGIHGFTCYAGRNSLFIRAPGGHGASANGWPVVVTPTGDVTTYGVEPLSGGVDPIIATTAGDPYPIVTTPPASSFHAVVEFTADGWTLVSFAADRPYYPNGIPIFDPSSRLLNLAGNPIVDEYQNVKYASGDVLGWDSGRLGIASVPPAGSGASGVAGMVTWDSGYLYVCTATDTWKRIALASF